MDTCEQWMNDPTMKYLYWGVILVVLLMVIYHLRNPENFSTGILEGCAHGQCPDLSNVQTLYSGKRQAYGQATRQQYNEEPFKLPPGSERFRKGIPGPSWESLLNVEQFKGGNGNASSGTMADPLQAALMGGSALNAPPGSLLG